MSPRTDDDGVRVTRVVGIPADEAWRLVTDVRNHARWIPLTRIDVDGAPTLGTTFAGVSGPGATSGGPGLVDRMVIERFDPPVPAHGTEPARTGVATFRKLGPVLLGTAEVQVRPLGPRHSTVTWVERVHLRGAPPAVTGWAMAPVLGLMLRLALRRMAAELPAAEH